MLLTILIGFIFSLLLIPFGKKFKASWSIIIPLIPTALFAYYLSYVPSVSEGLVFFQQTDWVPSLGVNFNFQLDGLGLLFSLLITGIGAGIFFYARAYLKGHPYFDRFFGYLLFFMSAMLGLVLSDNIFLLFIFWELTSISSFFLIGFNNDQEACQKERIDCIIHHWYGWFLSFSGTGTHWQYGRDIPNIRAHPTPRYHSRKPAIPACLMPTVPGSVYQIRPVPIPFLVAWRNESPDTCICVFTFCNNGQGGDLYSCAFLSDLRRHGAMELHLNGCRRIHHALCGSTLLIPIGS